jgi:hypothetical protein
MILIIEIMHWAAEGFLLRSGLRLLIGGGFTALGVAGLAAFILLAAPLSFETRLIYMLISPLASPLFAVISTSANKRTSLSLTLFGSGAMIVWSAVIWMFVYIQTSGGESYLVEFLAYMVSPVIACIIGFLFSLIIEKLVFGPIAQTDPVLELLCKSVIVLLLIPLLHELGLPYIPSAFGAGIYYIAVSRIRNTYHRHISPFPVIGISLFFGAQLQIAPMILMGYQGLINGLILTGIVLVSRIIGFFSIGRLLFKLKTISFNNILLFTATGPLGVLLFDYLISTANSGVPGPFSEKMLSAEIYFSIVLLLLVSAIWHAINYFVQPQPPVQETAAMAKKEDTQDIDTLQKSAP